MICYARLPVSVPLAAICKEVDAITDQWIPHLNRHDYKGDWEVLSLRSPGGATANIIPDLLGESAFADTELMERCPSIRALVGSLHCPVMSVRLLNLKKGAAIRRHRDRELSFEQGEARLHIPVYTNPEVEFYVEDNRVIMEEGTCWYINANLPHQVMNRGTTDRIHLVMDCKVDAWLTAWFEKAEKTMAETPYNTEEQRMIIHTLRAHSNETSNRLADQLQAQLDSYLAAAGPEEKTKCND